MSITFTTSNPSGLLAAFKKAIDEKHVETWSYDKDGDFTHTPPQWANLAWLQPTIGSGALHFGLLAPQGKGVTKTVYGVYHGRFIESMLSHCDELFTSGSASALVTSYDKI